MWARCTRVFVPAAIVAGTLITAGAAWADDDDERIFEVIVTNITRGQQFTPILVASHRPEVSLFELGKAASPGLQIVAEEGNVAPLTEALLAMHGVFDVTNSGALLNPGASVTIKIKVRGEFNRVSVASMLIPTNDAFFAINGAGLPRANQTQVLTSVAYDSGSERNDELCTSIPGPFFIECGGSGGGGAPSTGAEGYVHIHAGIHGIGDIDEAQRDWRNPVARISIRRAR